MFYYNGEFKEHYLGIMNMSSGQTAEKHYLATLDLCNHKGLDLAKVQFSDLDGCNTNSGDVQGFKQAVFLVSQSLPLTSHMQQPYPGSDPETQDY